MDMEGDIDDDDYDPNREAKAYGGKDDRYGTDEQGYDEYGDGDGSMGWRTYFFPNFLYLR